MIRKHIYLCVWILYSQEKIIKPKQTCYRGKLTILVLGMSWSLLEKQYSLSSLPPRCYFGKDCRQKREIATGLHHNSAA